MGVTSHGSKVYFGGGNATTGLSNLVEIYNPVVDIWETNTLSISRAFPTAIAVGDKVFFAGGINWNNLQEYDIVDIFDTLTQTWSVSNLSTPGFYLQSVSYQNTVLFAGFYDLVSFSPLSFTFSNVVNIYDAVSGNWSTDTLSQARGNFSATVVGDIALFAGGQTSLTAMSDRVDIYNFSTGMWSTASLSVARGFTAAVTVGNKAIFAGGTTSDNIQSDMVDIYDNDTGEWSTANLSFPRSFTTRGAAACGKAFFAGGGELNMPTFGFVNASNVVDIYDTGSGTWSADILSGSVVNHSVTAAQNHVLVAGGLLFTQPLSLNNLVEIYTCEASSTSHEQGAANLEIKVFPNPAENYVQLLAEDAESSVFQVNIFDMNGRLIKTLIMQNGTAFININDLSNGCYIVKVFNEVQITVQRLIKSDNQ